MYFATFAVIVEENKVWCTTRENGSVGLPGGKVDPDESDLEACIRECQEEGILVNPDNPIVVKTDNVEGKPVIWYQFKSAVPLTEYKEKYRGIKPVLMSIKELVDSNPSFKNDFLLDLV